MTLTEAATPRSYYKPALWAAALAVITFPEFDPSFGIGVDYSLAWAFNHFFAFDREAAMALAFPHGPLAFLMYPLPMGHNLGIALVFAFALQWWLMFVLLNLANWWAPERFAIALLITTAIGLMVNLNLALMFAVGASLLAHRTQKSWLWLVIAALLTAIGLNLRAGTGIICMALLATHCFMVLVMERDAKSVILSISVLVAALVSIRLWLFGSLAGTTDFFLALWHLAGASSAATAYYPINNWWVLLPAIGLFIALPLLMDDGRFKWAFVLFAPAIFAAWKHGMTREDLLHYQGFVHFAVVFMLMALLMVERVKWPALVAMLGIGVLLKANVEAVAGSAQPLGFEAPTNSFYRWVAHGNTLARKATDSSNAAIAPNRLNPSLMTELNGSSVDVYPWEFSYLAANNLAWSPRPVLQSYAAYTPWLDALDSAHFNSAQAPQHIILHHVPDQFGGQMGSIDGRYLFNDEPLTILELIRHYQWQNRESLTLLSRVNSPRLGTTSSIKTQTCNLNDWVDVPEVQDGILRVAIDMEGTIFRSIKDFLFKDEEYTVHYRLSDGTELHYRMVPGNAASGVWVNPLLRQPSSARAGPLVEAIMFSCTDSRAVRNPITLNWQLTEVLSQVPAMSGKYAKAWALFGKEVVAEQQDWIHQSVSFEPNNSAGSWSFEPTSLTDSVAQQGQFSQTVGPNGYSATFVHRCDTVMGSVSVAVSGWCTGGPAVGLVISVEFQNGEVFWQSQPFEPNDDRQWQRGSIIRTINLKPGAVLKAYLLNSGTATVLADQLSIRVTAN